MAITTQCMDQKSNKDTKEEETGRPTPPPIYLLDLHHLYDIHQVHRHYQSTTNMIDPDISDLGYLFDIIQKIENDKYFGVIIWSVTSIYDYISNNSIHTLNKDGFSSTVKLISNLN